MQDFFGILSLLSILGFILGLFSPEKSLFWAKQGQERTRKLSAGVYSVLILLGFAGIGIFAPKKDKAISKITQDTTQAQTKKEELGDTSTIKMPESVKNLAKELKENAKNTPQETSQSLTYIPGLTAVG